MEVAERRTAIAEEVGVWLAGFFHRGVPRVRVLGSVENMYVIEVLFGYGVVARLQISCEALEHAVSSAEIIRHLVIGKVPERIGADPRLRLRYLDGGVIVEV